MNINIDQAGNVSPTVWFSLGHTFILADRHEAAFIACFQALQLARAQSDLQTIGDSLLALAGLSPWGPEMDGVDLWQCRRRFCAEAMSVFELLGDSHGMVRCMLINAQHAEPEGRDAAFRECLSHAQACNDVDAEIQAFRGLALNHLQQGDRAAAKRDFHDALDACGRSSCPTMRIIVLESYALAFESSDDARRQLHEELFEECRTLGLQERLVENILVAVTLDDTYSDEARMVLLKEALAVALKDHMWTKHLLILDAMTDLYTKCGDADNAERVNAIVGHLRSADVKLDAFTPPRVSEDFEKLIPRW